jgi:cell division protein FtsL
MNWLKLLLGLAALLIAGCAAYFSVTGLGVLFSGASTAVMIMAGSLEFAKLVSASYLKQRWSEIGGFNKIYLTLSVGVLMFITSLGIFGYLSNAFQQQNLKLQQINREISVWESKITQDTVQIGQLTKQITELNQNQGKIIGDGKVNNRILKSVDNRDAQIGKLQDKIGILQDSVVVFNEKINEIKNNNIDTEREVGGFRFVAEAFGIELNTVVKFFIILIVLVFDPLAIALIIAFNGMLYKKPEVPSEDTNNSDKTYEIYGEKSSLVENILQKPDDSGKFSPKPDEIPVIVENSQQEEPEVEFIPNPEENHNIVVNKSNYPTDFDSKTY